MITVIGRAGLGLSHKSDIPASQPTHMHHIRLAFFGRFQLKGDISSQELVRCLNRMQFPTFCSVLLLEDLYKPVDDAQT